MVEGTRVLTRASVATVATDVLGRSDLVRNRAFHRMGAVGALIAAVVGAIVGRDPLARLMFCVGATVLSLSNVVLLFLGTNERRYRSPVVPALWIVCTFATLTFLYFGGPFSNAMIVPTLGVIFIVLDRQRAATFAVPALFIAGSLVLASLVIFGVIDDRGVFTARSMTKTQLAGCEMLVVACLGGAWVLARRTRKSVERALEELESAMRVIDDQAQVLADVNVDVARARAVNEGRWTGHQMGAWRLGLMLGRGAMGEVYEAAADGQTAAVKLLDARAAASPAQIERFHREMAIAERLESPHIVKVLALAPPDAHVPYYAMERLHGEDLAARLRKEHRLPLDQVAVLVEHVARALEVARVAGVVHRDLKPHNVIFHDGTTWKVLDFGVSKLMDGEGTLTGDAIVGTPQYMAPEQASGGAVTPLADVYSLGSIAYRCLTGRTPFKGELAEMIYKLMHTPPLRPSLLAELPRALDDVLALAMAKDPRRRFPSAQAFSDALAAARTGGEVALVVPDDAWLG